MPAELQYPKPCPSPEISSYIDGELSHVQETELERHIAECGLCTEDLKLQRQFLCALDATLDNEPELDLPENFTRIVVTRAETRVSGLRRRGERFNAAFICSGLVLVALLALGTDTSTVLAVLASIFEKAVAVGGFVLHVAYDIAVGAVVVLRSLTSHLIYGRPEAVAVPTILGFQIYVISRVAAFLQRT